MHAHLTMRSSQIVQIFRIMNWQWHQIDTGIDCNTVKNTVRSLLPPGGQNQYTIPLAHGK